MKHIKRFNESEEKVKDQEMGFDAESLIDGDEIPGFTTSIDDPEKDDKEFKKELDKVEKFESFIYCSVSEKLQYHIDNKKSIVENVFRQEKTKQK